MFKTSLALTILASLLYVVKSDYTSLPPPCSSQIYCYGDLLETVARSGIYNDSKTFVDLKLVKSANETLNAFSYVNQTNNEEVKVFVNEYFEQVAAVEPAQLVDFKRNQTFLDKICNTTVKTFAEQLIEIWPDLARKVTEDVHQNPDLYSFIPVPNNFVVPGGRFSEYYYWDSYWVIEGLLISEMYETAKGMLDNFIYLVDTFGFIPNGGRLYYLNRSQPPLLASMVSLYYEYTGDIEWVKANLDVVAKELSFWLKNNTVTVETDKGNYTVARYYSPYSGPRPESYAEDLKTASVGNTEEERQKIYVELKSAAESGWDFSSRWLFNAEGGYDDDLANIEITRVIPVDLNSFLCRGFRVVAELYELTGQTVDSNVWRAIYDSWVEAVDAVLWNDDESVWFDYDTKLKIHRKGAYPSNITPLWASCHAEEKTTYLTKKGYEYLSKIDIFRYVGGISTSDVNTGQQWDFPNAWPPLQHIMVYALAGKGVTEADEAVKELVNKWVYSNMLGLIETGEMFEKYDVEVPGQYGGGGEYVVQSGFGWTNGVDLKFVSDFFTCN